MEPPLFGKGFCGRLRLLEMATAGILVMVVGSGFGRISGLVALVWLSNTGLFISFVMKKG